jgi:hypothetical protein
MFLHKELKDSASSCVSGIALTALQRAMNKPAKGFDWNFSIKLFALTLLIAGYASPAFSQSATTLTLTIGTDATTGTWTVPDGVVNIKIEVWGGGGGGGGANGTGTSGEGRGGGGGGGGAYRSNSNYAVTPGAGLAYTIGAGGAAGHATDGAGQTDGEDGVTTTIDGISALGGAGGKTAINSPDPGDGLETGAGGAGASAGAALANQTVFAGGNGAAGEQDGGSSDDADKSGGGGGGAGSNQNGANSGNHNGANGGNALAGSLAGGDGGDGRDNSTNVGNPGSLRGGGGGGGFTLGPANTDQDGGAGGNGQIRISYTIPIVSSIDLEAADDSGVNTDNITNIDDLTITGTTSANNTISVQLYDGVTAVGAPVNPNNTTGVWTVQLNDVTTGTKNYTARATHTNGNYSTSAVMQVVVDQTAPTSVIITNTGTDPEYDNTATFNFQFNEAVSNFIAADITSGGTATYTFSAPNSSDGGFNWTTTATATVAGTVIPSLDLNTVTDIAGNVAGSAVTAGPTVNIAPFEPTDAGTIGFQNQTTNSVEVTHAGGVGATHYVVVAVSGAGPTTFVATDGTDYAPGASSDFGVAATQGANRILGVVASGAFPFTVTGLTGGQQYTFGAYAVNGVGTLPNYFGTQAAGTTSTPDDDVVTLADGATPEVAVHTYLTASPGTFVFDFQVIDGADGFDARISDIIIAEGSGDSFADWSLVLAGAEITDGSLTLAASNITANTIEFTGINPATLGLITSGGNKTYSVRVWLEPTLPNPFPTTIDGLFLSFLVDNSSFTFLNTGSGLAASQSVASGSTNNEIDILATELVFLPGKQPPANALATVPFAAGDQPILEARDANGNLDLDAIPATVATSDPDELNAAGAPTQFTNGVMDFSTAATFRYDRTGTSNLVVSTTSPALSVTSTQATTVTASTAVAQISAGLLSGDLQSGSFNNGILGFSLATTGSTMAFTDLTVSVNNDPAGKILNAHLFVSPSSSFTLVGATVLRTVSNPSGGTINFAAFNTPITSVPTYYYVMVDVEAVLPNYDPLEITLTPNTTNVVTRIGGVQQGTVTGAPFSGDNYAFEDITAPTLVSILNNAPLISLALNEQIVTVVFNEPMNTLTTPLITIDGLFDASDIVGLGWTSSTTYAIRFTHSGDPNELDPAYSHIVAGGAQDVAGNTFAGSANSLGFIIDTTPPTPSVNRSNGMVTHTVPTQLVTVTYLETVTGAQPTIEFWLGASNLTSSFTSNGDGAWAAVPHKIWTETFTYTVDEQDLAGVVARVVAGAPIADVAGNAGLVGNSTTFNIDTNEPIITYTYSYDGVGYYNQGDILTGEVGFDQVIVVSGTPTITMTSGGTASVTGFGGATWFQWQYIVGPGENTTEMEVQSFNFDGTNHFRDINGNDINPSVVTPNDMTFYAGGQLIIDTTIPTVNSVSSATGTGYYNAGDAISIQVNFSEPVNLFTLPTLALNTGGTATYVSGAGTATINFTYLVLAGHNNVDLDYTATNSLVGDIRDLAGNFATLTLATPNTLNSISDNLDIRIDTQAPTVSSVISTTGNGFYNAGDIITIQVNFSETVNVVSGTPSLSLNAGGTAIATYTGVGSGTTTLNFSYTVAAGHNSGDLDYAGIASLAGNIQDLAQNSANLLLATPGTAGSISDNQAIVIDTQAPAVSFVVSTNTDGYYNAGEAIIIEVTFNEIVNVNSGTPSLALNSGGTATYTGGTGTNKLTFLYTVLATQNSNDLDYSNTAALTGDIRDQADNVAPLTLATPGNINSISDNQAIRIDTVTPTVSSVSSPNANGFYNAGDIITINVVFSEPVEVVSGTPTLALNSGGTASYSSGEGTNTLTFLYTVLATENSDDLDYTATNSLTGDIRDFADNVATLTLASPGATNSISDNQAIDIDTVTPTVTSVSSTNANGFYNAGEIITIHVVFSEPVFASGAETLDLNSGATATAYYAGGSGTNTLIFTYEVLAGENSDDLDYDNTSSLAGTIADFANNTANLTLAVPGAANSISDNQAIDIDTVVPTVTSVSSTAANGYYNAGEVITINIVFSEPAVVASGTPFLSLNSGGTAFYSSGTGTTTLTFTYTVLATENSDDLDYINTSSLNGDIRDLGDNNAILTLPAPGAVNSISDNQAIDIDTVTPTVVSVSSSTPNGYYNAGEVISIQILYSEPVDVTGTPTLALNSGGTATFLNGSGTSTLNFTYTVLATQNSDDLDYSATNSLALAGGTIEDLADNTADLTLPSPAAVNSISDDQAIDIDTVTPTVLSVSSSTIDGYYNAGDVISIQVNFSEPVDVTGTPTLALNSGGTATYLSGSGLSTLNFTYTVLATQNSNDLDYSATNSLALAGGTIEDFADNTAALTLPAPGAVNSISDNQTIDIDTQQETVLSVSATNTDGYYNAGDLIVIEVKFSEPVNGFGTPTLDLNSGGTAVATYSSGEGTDTFTFHYVVAVGENIDDLDYDATNSLNGTIEDFAGNSAILTLPAPGAANSISDNQTIDIDTILPEMVVGGNTIDVGLLIGIGSTNGTTASTVTFDVTFSEPVTGVDPTDFVLTHFDHNGNTIYGTPAYPEITSAIPVGGVSGTAPTDTYTVTVNVASGTGRLRLDLDPSGTILDLAQNDNILGFTTGEVYSIVRPEPSNHPTGLSASAPSPSTVDFSWTNSVAGVTPTHLLITATGPAALTEVVPAEFIPDDGFIYPEDDDYTDGQGLLIIDLVNNPLQQLVTFENLRSGKEYTFKIFPYSLTPNNSSDNANYIRTGNAFTDATTQTSAVGTLTSINTGVPATISSLNATFTDVNFSFQITDDGLTPASDDAKMFINQIIIKADAGNTVTDWSEVIEEAELEEVTDSPGLKILTTDISANTITFDLSGQMTDEKPGEVDDDETKEYRMRLRLKTSFGGNAPHNVDGQRFEFLVDPDNNPALSSFTYEPNSSRILDTESATSDHLGLPLVGLNTNNRVNVIATQFDYTTQPPATIMVLKDVISASAAPDNAIVPVVRARDANGNTDKGYNNVLVQFTNAGNIPMLPGNTTTLNVNMVEGIAPLPADFQYADDGDGQLTIHSATPNEISASIPDQQSSAITVNYSNNTEINDGAETEAPVISSLLTTAAQAIMVFDFTVKDYNVDASHDGAPTRITQIKITDGAGNEINWSEAIEAAYLFNEEEGMSHSALPADITADEILFDAFSFNNSGDFGYVPAGGSRTYQLFIHLRPDLQGTLKDDIDNKHFQFKVDASDVLLNTLSSSFAPAETSHSDTDGNQNNRVEVITTALIFITEPPALAFVNTDLTVSPIVEAQDIHGNRDLDYTLNGSAVEITNGGTLPMDDAPTDFVNGVLTFPTTFQYAHIGNGIGDLTVDTNIPAANSLEPTKAESTPVLVRVATSTTITLVPSATPATISSLTDTELEAATVFQFEIEDDGGSENDGNPTQINSLTIQAGAGDEIAFNPAYNWTHAIAGVTLDDGNGNDVTILAPNPAIAANSISFDLSGSLGLIADDATETYTLKLWFRNDIPNDDPTDLGNEIDGLHLEFAVSVADIVIDDTNSEFVPGGSANSGPGNVNIVDVDATQLDITTPTPPAPVASLNTPYAVTVQARDVNQNRDLDFTGATSTITDLGNKSNVDMFSTPTVEGREFTNGVYVFPSDFQFTSGEDEQDVTLNMLAGGISTVNVVDPAPPAPFTPRILLSSSFESVLIVDPDFVPELDIRYERYQDIIDDDINFDTKSIALAQFKLFDGADTDLDGDADGANTNIKDITFSITNPENIRALAIYKDGTLVPGTVKNNSDFVTVAGVTNVTFTNLSSELVAQDATRSMVFTIRASFFNTAAEIDDNDELILHVTNVTQSGGSKFNDAPGNIGGKLGGVGSDPNVKIEVMATVLNFTVQPPAYAPIDNSVSIDPVVHALDKNGVVDEDVNGLPNGAVLITSGDSGPKMDATISNPPASFVNGQLDFPSLRYTTPGDGTITAQITNGVDSVVVTTSNLVDVLHVTALKATKEIAGEGADTYILRGGDKAQALFGITFQAPYIAGAEPKIEDFSVDFGTGAGNIDALFQNIEVYRSLDNVWDGAVGETNVATEGGGYARATLEGKTLHVTYYPSAEPDVAIPVPQELFVTDNPDPAPDTYEVTYFIVADISTTVSAATPPVQLIIKDLGSGSGEEADITTSQGSVYADLEGTIFSFASVNAPVITRSYPATGQLNVSTSQPTINVEFSVPVEVVGPKYFLLVQKNNTSVRDTLRVLNYVDGTEIDSVQFGITEGFLQPNTVYYITAGSDVIEDSDGKPMLAITYPDLFYFRTADPNAAPVLLPSPAPSITQRSKTGATIKANFDKQGRAYFLVLPNNSVKPDYREITGEFIHPDSVFNGQIDIQQTNTISSFGLITAPLDANTEYDVWIYAEGYRMVSNNIRWFESVPDTISNSAAFGGGPNYALTGTTPTLKIPVMTIAQTGIQVFAPSFALCSNSYQPQNLPITIVEKIETDFDTGGVERSFNLLLPTGYQFDNSAVDGVPNHGKVILTGDDFDGEGSLTYLNNSIVTIKFKTNPGTGSSLDNISIIGLRIIAASQADPGNLTRLGGQAIPTFGDGYIFASVSTDDASTIGFTNSYSKLVFGDPKPPVTIIPDNYGEVELIPLPSANDFGPSAFNGPGVTINKLNLPAVPIDIPFQITITHTDNNGCISQNSVQYTKYDHNTAIADLSTQDCLENLNFFGAAPSNVKFVRALADTAKQNFLRKLKATLPVLPVVPGVDKPLMNRDNQQWLDFIEGRDLVNGLFLERDGDSLAIDNTTSKKMQSYKYDVAKLMNVSFMRAYDSLRELSPNGQPYWISQMLGVIEYTATYVNLSNRQLDFPKKQNVEYWLKAKPVIDVSGTGKQASVADTVSVFCRSNGTISIAGYPDAAPGPFHAYFTLFNHAANSADSLDTEGAEGFTDNGNGTAQIDPTKFNNNFEIIRIEYTYKLDGSPCESKATAYIRITPNPVAKFRILTDACIQSDITFDGSISDFGGEEDDDFTVTNWLWDFDDPNATGTSGGADGPDAQPEHIYNVSQVYTPTLKVTSIFGCESPLLDNQTLEVGGIPVVDFSFIGVSKEDTIAFTSLSQPTSHPLVDDGIDELDWDFGGAGNDIPDGSSNYKYATVGHKTVVLTATSLLGCSATTSKKIVVLDWDEVTDADSYSEDFEADSTSWQVLTYDGTVAPSWKWDDAPAGTDRTIVLDATNGQRVWITSKNAGGYNGLEKSAIYSPSLDMSDANLSRPMISLRTARELASGDGVVLEYSTDKLNVVDPNKVWKILIGKSGVVNGESTGDKWFNAQGLGSQPGGIQTTGYGWAGSSHWIDSKHILDTLLTETNDLKHVVFRLALGSVSGNPGSEGFAFDNVRIGNRTRTVLVENFTNLGNTVKVGTRDAETLVREKIRTFRQNDDGTRLVRLNYHVGFPKPDPFNLDNPQDANSRALFYGIRETPRTRLDGIGPTLDGELFTIWGERAYNINTLRLAEAKLTPHVQTAPGGLSITVDIEGIVFGKKIPEGTILHVAIVEDSINYDDLPQAKRDLVKTEDRVFSYVVKKMLPSAVGTRLPNDIDFEDTYTTPIPLVWEADMKRLYASVDSVTVVVFLQDEKTGYVYQSESVKFADPGVITGVEDGLRIEDVVVYPNPSNQEMNILLPRRAIGDVNLNLIDQMGKYVMGDKIPDGERSKTLDVQGLSSGVYILQLQENGHTTFRKMMVVH